MLEITTAIFITLLGSAFYHLLPARNMRLRLAFVALLSFVIVFAHFPVAALAATATGVLAWIIAIYSLRYAPVAKYGPFLLIAVLAAFSFREIEVQTSPLDKTLLQFGMSYYILRLYLVLRTTTVRKERLHLEEYLAIALFFPIFPAGPICAQEAFSRSPALQRPLLHNYLLGLYHIGIGIIALYFVTGVLDDLADSLIVGLKTRPFWLQMDPSATYAVMMLKFAHLYANFAGYTKIAIGLGLFFGFQLPENFRYPFLATNIQNFWQRWHLSLSRFITTLIYMPILLSIRKPRVSMFLAFTLVGLWHQLTPQYLVWGIGHGGMMALYMGLSKNRQVARVAGALGPVWTVLAWLTTMSAVAFLSMFANEATWELALKFVHSLFGLQWSD